MPIKNPVEKLDPRYSPSNDAENEAAHDVDWGEAPKPKKAKKSSKKKAADADVQEIVRRSLERAIKHYEENIEPDQTEATDYYHGRPFGDEEEGRSKVVSTDVRDATLAQLPSLLRVFTGPERAVEFMPRGAEDEAQAKQITDYINYIIYNDNPGFTNIHSWLKDGLVRRIGWVKWWWDEFYRVEVSEYSGLDEEGVLALANDVDVDELEVTGQSDRGIDVRVTRTEKDGCAKFMAIPNEEVVFTPNARSLESAPLVAHVREVPAEELYALGIDRSLVDEAAGKTKARRGSASLEDAREFDDGASWNRDEDEDLDPTQRPVLFAEAFCLVDGDGDDRAELRKLWCVGPDYEIANGDGLGEIVDEIPLAMWGPEPEPHTMIGLSNHDLLKDVQRVNSQLERGMLNSLALSLEPKTEVVNGMVNIADLNNPEIAGIIRVEKPGMMREVTHTFLGAQVLPVLEYQSQKKEARTGHTKAAAGLDADSLQSSTKAAVAATLSASQQRLEMIARIFAETGMRRLMKGLLRLVVKHQNRERIVRLRGQYVPIDPRAWDTSMDLSVNVGLGQGSPEDRLFSLDSQIGQMVELKGLGAPFITWAHIRSALVKRAELSGWSNPAQFFGEWSEQDEMQMQQAMQQQGPPQDPNMMLVQVEAMKAQHDAEMAERKLALEEKKLLLEDDRERDKIARESALKERELELKHAVEIHDAQLQAQVARDRAAMDADVKREQTANQPTEQAA